MTTPNKPGFAVWVQAARPWTLGVAVSPVLMGTIIAHTEGGIQWLAAIAAMLGGIFIQIGTNLANDYFDFKKGADTESRVGPQRVTQSGLIAPEAVRKGFIACFGLSFVLGIYLVYLWGWPIVIIGLLALLLGVIYTGGPFPLAYYGLAELPAFLFFGPIACATTTFVQIGSWSTAALIAGVSAGFFSVALLSINNLRDYQEDRKVGKRTLIARFGRRFGVIEYGFSILSATLIPLSFLYFAPTHSMIGITAISSLMALHALRITINYREPSELYAVLKMTSKLQIIFTVIFSVTWVI
ncbi:MAG: 1,4-dihydroxy-2-naphthoate polyprenyltransferase [Candidatus Marinimicrobia bacterium]|nr:1,4-dihydroxy-2-naphthoate polyprenyltransferase [Candidatus Neomarinimicrobiota bacterium]MBT3574551.1 1,4-dihydroxy-2-naphthoate polyprenyltransferase [Candidatus Neomarinimicrobiota bacterium]MBT3680481.1 1,4-dihydroxy-2-naphthoate polyprenyltransferase [Candidatus Neomarinimicrobiota bacterium]MBT3951217.1 1,4-dihydroxy-2-naphthoate polyprenyltransferase [Candidatus Neomarinimicrobiota bacterium]MBT4253014.1 1,4-dihydroxy-2-naphthoate polyprenyltransferase [Candidatus Neomarinimicrobiota